MTSIPESGGDYLQTLLTTLAKLSHLFTPLVRIKSRLRQFEPCLPFFFLSYVLCFYLFLLCSVSIVCFRELQSECAASHPTLPSTPPSRREGLLERNECVPIAASLPCPTALVVGGGITVFLLLAFPLAALVVFTADD
jgi:hypothetical protein